ncbi:hypothetical protein NDU88_007975 [Pleurodeles waltl]|uniref:Uncharacterized protein n=1 Tax=Pleurodeles waltl TaxID=8319 RepID=A0AAV7RWE5_PLEWA|nr:hypothetical protein NDU88_007975 [Pleurodeles waltl]
MQGGGWWPDFLQSPRQSHGWALLGEAGVGGLPTALVIEAGGPRRLQRVVPGTSRVRLELGALPAPTGDLTASGGGEEECSRGPGREEEPVRWRGGPVPPCLGDGNSGPTQRMGASVRRERCAGPPVARLGPEHCQTCLENLLRLAARCRGGVRALGAASGGQCARE